MKKNFLLGLMILMTTALSFISCSDENDEPLYYVRYTVGANAGDDFFISYNDADNSEGIKQQISTDGKVEIIIGPVHTGFETKLAASVNGGHAPNYLQIDVSCNERPFVQKAYLQNGTYIYYNITLEDR